uniref:DUF1353 domain-containing protein n=1 Tax=Janibacter limosus TaxID=53458 RepID=A0AC61U8A3_9MICO|nr:DUF1353 domain-containing protein [Janibacter limosus]
MDVDEFHMGRRLAYRDRELGQLLVPVDMTTFSTDLTSVPSIFLWLVPRLGRHLPAALLHDGLVSGSFTAAPGVTIDRERADLVFRAAMADTGTGLIRRWLMWTAVTLGTIFQGPQHHVVGGRATALAGHCRRHPRAHRVAGCHRHT